jgi:large subunit ribosomal protein L33
VLVVGQAELRRASLPQQRQRAALAGPLPAWLLRPAAWELPPPLASREEPGQASPCLTGFGWPCDSARERVPITTVFIVLAAGMFANRDPGFWPVRRGVAGGPAAGRLRSRATIHRPWQPRFGMAKGKRKLEVVHLVCEETGDQNYTLRRKTGGEKLKVKKYSPRLRKHTLHNEKRK